MSASHYRIYFLLQRAAHLLKTEADAVMTQSGGMTTAQAAVVGLIARDGPVTQKHIADTLSQRESAVTTMANRLLKANYITRVKSPEDARAWALEVTTEGRAASENMRKPFATINERLDEQINADAMEEFAANLDRIIAAFERRQSSDQ